MRDPYVEEDLPVHPQLRRARAPRRLGWAARGRALLLLGGVALVPAGLGATLVAGSGSSAPGLTLASDADGAALVSAAGLAPGHDVTRCLQLNYGNAIASDRILLMTSSSGSLPGYMSVRVESGTGGSSTSCSGFSGDFVYSGSLQGLGEQHGTAQTALPMRELPSGSGSVSVRLRFSVNSDNAAQGLSGASDLVWIADAVGDRTAPPPVVTPVDPPPPSTPTSRPPTRTPSAPAPAPTAPAPVRTPVDVPPAQDPVPASIDPSPAPTTSPPGVAPQPTSDPSSARPSPVATDSDASSAAAAPADPPRPTGSPGRAKEPGAVGRVQQAFTSGVKSMASAASGLAKSVQEHVLRPMATAAAPAARGATYGLGGTAPLLGAFLLIQGRIDRRDPKLALAPAYADPDLTFDDIPRGPLSRRAHTGPGSGPDDGTTP